MRIGLAGAALLASSLALAGCEDPKPGLEDEVRVEKVVDCKSAIRRFAPTDAKREQLCQCTTARLAQQNLTIADLSGAKRDRAMEQLRWCLAQVGLGPKRQTKAPTPVDGIEPDTSQPEEPPMQEAPAEEAGALEAGE